MKKIICAFLFSTPFASASPTTTHIVSVKQDVDLVECANEIQKKTSAKVVEFFKNFRLIGIESDKDGSAQVASLSCVYAVQENEFFQLTD